MSNSLVKRLSTFAERFSYHTLDVKSQSKDPRLLSPCELVPIFGQGRILVSGQ